MMCLSHSRMSLRIFVVSAAMLAALILDVRVSSARQEQLTADQAAARAKLAVRGDTRVRPARAA